MLDVNAVWWVDDAATQTRRLRSEKIGVYDRRAVPAALEQQLKEALTMVDRWTLENLGPPHGPFKPAPEEAAGHELRQR